MRLTLIIILGAIGSAAWGWDDARLATPLVINDRIVPYPVFAIYVMPDAPIRLNLLDSIEGGEVTYNGVTGAIGSVELRAPRAHGLTQMSIVMRGTGERANVNVFTMVPATKVDKKGYLNGYHIGQYPERPLRGMDIYLPPRGFVEVTEDLLDTQISPNFKLRPFVSKQAHGFPKYLLLRANLLLKLENVLATLNRSGHATDRFVTMSGYRTPFYNKVIGNGHYSRHVWGGAADIYIDDDPRDGRMDDLNGDGRIDIGDARWLADFINEMSKRGDFGERIGGLGVYGSTTAHGPFVHVDVRGVLARW